MGSGVVVKERCDAGFREKWCVVGETLKKTDQDISEGVKSENLIRDRIDFKSRERFLPREKKY